jgi:hypothetical protein
MPLPSSLPSFPKALDPSHLNHSHYQQTQQGLRLPSNPTLRELTPEHRDGQKGWTLQTENRQHDWIQDKAYTENVPHSPRKEASIRPKDVSMSNKDVSIKHKAFSINHKEVSFKHSIRPVAIPEKVDPILHDATIKQRGEVAVKPITLSGQHLTAGASRFTAASLQLEELVSHFTLHSCLTAFGKSLCRT